MRSWLWWQKTRRILQVPATDDLHIMTENGAELLTELGANIDTEY